MKQLSRSFVFFFLIIIMGSKTLIAQSTESESVRTALKTGSSKELVGMLDNQFELTLFEKKYNKNNCESVLRNFFNSNPSTSFKYVHKGASKDGTLSYSIGHYETSNSKYRVVIRFRKSGDQFKIHKLEVSDL